MRGDERRAVQLGVRIGALVFVVAWLFSSWLQGVVPFWLPFLALALTELEFVALGWWEARSGAARETTSSARSRRLPGADDADLGWVETVDEEGEVILVPAPPRTRGRRHRWAVVLGVGVALALFVAALQVDQRDSWTSLSTADRRMAEARFSREASRIAGEPVTVECDESYAFTGVGSDAAGVAFPRQKLAYLEPGVCRSLYRITYGNSVGSRDAAGWAITVLAHEAVHLQGIRSESVTECHALQEGGALGQRLGLSERDAAALMRAQLERALADRSIDRAAYRLPAGCVEGGELDLRPDDPSFP